MSPAETMFQPGFSNIGYAASMILAGQKSQLGNWIIDL